LGDLVNAVHDDLAPFAADADKALCDQTVASAPCAAAAPGAAAAAAADALLAASDAAARRSARAACASASDAAAFDDASPLLPTARAFYAEV
jgi:hypothetical protein